MRRIPALSAAIIMVTATSAMAAQPRVLPGWPTVAGAGTTLVEGTVGDTVVVTDSGPTQSSVASIRRNGTRRWLSILQWGCGNCDDGGALARALPDGSIGPIGPEGDGVAGVDLAGQRVGTCVGVMLHDTTCIQHDTRFGVTDAIGAIVATRAGAVIWENVRPAGAWYWAEGLEAPPLIFADDAGATVYTTFGGLGPMVALDTATGVERWRIDGATPLAGLSTGVLAQSPTLGLTRFRPDGSVMWSLPARSFRGHTILVDPTRERIYASQRTFRGGPRFITALDALTGSELWRTKPVDRAGVLSIRRNGTVLAAIDRPGRTGLRAIGADGKGRWQFDTATRVSAALGMSNGTVALTTEGGPPDFAYESGLVWRIEPRQRVDVPKRAAVALRGRRFVTGCFGCPYKTNVGMSLRFDVPQRTTFRLRLLTPGGAEMNETRRFVTAPAGTSAVRYGVFAYPKAMNAVLEVRSTTDLSVFSRFHVRLVPG